MNFDNFKKIMQDKKKVVMVSVAVLLLLLAIVGTTYAYFTATVIGNKDDNNVVITNGVMALEYIDGNQVALTNAVPGDKVTKTFKVKNTGNVTTTYTIYMSELINDFADKTDLVYTLTGTNGGKNVSETQVPDSSSAIASDVSIDAGVTQEYTLVITFKETNDVQDDNQGKNFSTKIQINEMKDANVSLPADGTRYLTSQFLNAPMTEKCDSKYTYDEENDITTETKTCYEVNDTFANDDPDNNIRYIGKDPSNYVYFNCSDYTNQSDETCEKWRIIGVFNDVKIASGSSNKLLKIIRSEDIGKFAWDVKYEDGVETNSVAWSGSSLEKLLNDVYFNGTKDSIYNGERDCVNVSSSSYSCTPKKTDVDFTNIGLKNDKTRNAIENVIWPLGSITELNYNSYNEEKSSNIYIYNYDDGSVKTDTLSWTGKINLEYVSDDVMSVSDYWARKEKTLCELSQSYYGTSYLVTNSNGYKGRYIQGNWNNCEHGPCFTSNYSLFVSFGSFTSQPYVQYYIKPTLFLKSGMVIKSGDGTSLNPYQLEI